MIILLFSTIFLFAIQSFPFYIRYKFEEAIRKK